LSKKHGFKDFVVCNRVLIVTATGINQVKIKKKVGECMFLPHGA
jgi:hypothetical protein